MKKKSAFTLVELLVVIGIIAILISILIPALNRARERSKEIMCQNNMRSLYLASFMFAQDHSQKLPRPTLWPESGSDIRIDNTCLFGMGSPGIADYTTGVIWQYIGGGIDTQKTVWICPSDITARDQLRSGGSASPVERNFSYSFNGRMAHDHFSTQATNGPTPIKTTDVKKATQKIMIIEEYGPNDTWNIMPGVDDQPSGRHGTNSSTGFQSLGFYQTGKGNYVFFDGHVESIGVSDILDPKNLEWYLNLEIPSQN